MDLKCFCENDTTACCVCGCNMCSVIVSCRLSLCLWADTDRGGLFHIGSSSPRQICLNLLLNNSVDLFDCWTEPRSEGDSDVHLISSHLTSWFFYAEVTEPQLFILNPPPISRTPSAVAKVGFLTSLQKKQSALKSLHFYSYKYRFGAPQIQSQSGSVTDSFLLLIQTLTKFTSTPLIDSNHQHAIAAGYQGAWLWICRMNIVEDDLITLQLTFPIIVLFSHKQSTKHCFTME